MKEVQDILDHYAGNAGKQEKMIQASSHWVWTTKAEQQSRGQRRAGKRIDTIWQPLAPVWMIEQGLIIDAEVYPYKAGQVDLYDML